MQRLNYIKKGHLVKRRDYQQVSKVSVTNLKSKVIQIFIVNLQLTFIDFQTVLISSNTLLFSMFPIFYV